MAVSYNGNMRSSEPISAPVAVLVYVPAPVGMVLGRPGHSGLCDRPGQPDRSQVVTDLLRRGLALVHSWGAA